MARLTARAMVAELGQFRSHEQRHRALFAAELQRRGRPRCRSYWLCGLGGMVLGLLTGLFGARAIAATAVAVERVVLRHLEHQLQVLAVTDPAAVVAISAIVAEERQHQVRAAEHVAPTDGWSKLLTPLVSTATEAVIGLGMRW